MEFYGGFRLFVSGNGLFRWTLQWPFDLVARRSSDKSGSLHMTSRPRTCLFVVLGWQMWKLDGSKTQAKTKESQQKPGKTHKNPGFLSSCLLKKKTSLFSCLAKPHAGGGALPLARHRTYRKG